MFFIMATEIEKFVALGREIGLEGDELRSFVKEQQDLVCEERFRAREAEKEARVAEQEQQERQALELFDLRAMEMCHTFNK